MRKILRLILSMILAALISTESVYAATSANISAIGITPQGLDDSEFSYLRCYADDALEAGRPYPPDPAEAAVQHLSQDYTASSLAVDLARDALDSASAAAKGSFSPQVVYLGDSSSLDYAAWIKYLAVLEALNAVAKVDLLYAEYQLKTAKEELAKLPSSPGAVIKSLGIKGAKAAGNAVAGGVLDPEVVGGIVITQVAFGGIGLASRRKTYQDAITKYEAKVPVLRAIYENGVANYNSEEARFISAFPSGGVTFALFSVPNASLVLAQATAQTAYDLAVATRNAAGETFTSALIALEGGASALPSCDSVELANALTTYCNDVITVAGFTPFPSSEEKYPGEAQWIKEQLLEMCDVVSFALFGGTSEQIIAETFTTIEAFMATRSDQIIINLPDLAWRLGGGAPSGARAGQLLGYANDQSSDLKFTTSLREIDAWSARLGGEDQADPARLDVWVNSHFAHANTTTSKSYIGLFSLGADYQVNAHLLVGISGQLDWSGLNALTGTATSKGLGWMAGPYFVASPVENIYLDARVLGGQSYNEVSPFGVTTDKFETTRWLASAKLSGQFEVGAFGIVPAAAVVYFQENQGGFVNAQSLTIPGQTATTGSAIVGPEFNYDFALENEAVLTPRIGVDGVWDFTRKGAILDQLRARARVGLAYTIANGTNFDAEGFYDGIGVSGYSAYGGSLSAMVPIN